MLNCNRYIKSIHYTYTIRKCTKHSSTISYLKNDEGNYENVISTIFSLSDF